MNFEYQYHFNKAMEYNDQKEYEKAIVHLKVAVSIKDDALQMKQLFKQYVESVEYDKYLLERTSESFIVEAIFAGQYEEANHVLISMLMKDDSGLRNIWCSYNNINLYKLLEVTLWECENAVPAEKLSINRYKKDRTIDLLKLKKDFERLQLYVMRIWFGLSAESQSEIVSYVKEHQTSIELLLVIAKYSVDLACGYDVFMKMSDLFKEESSHYAQALIWCAENVLKKCADHTRTCDIDAEDTRDKKIVDERFADETFVYKKMEYTELDASKGQNLNVDSGENGITGSEKCVSSELDSHKIAIVMCGNDSDWIRENELYLARQKVPAGYELEVIVVKNAIGMCQGYNVAMNHSTAKFKIYVHQDLFLIKDDAVYKIIQALEQSADVGMIGIAGAKHMSADGIWWNVPVEDMHSNLYQYVGLGTNLEYKEQGLFLVEALDGVLLATSVDVTWREDIFKGWHFYDIAQCREIKKTGRNLAVLTDGFCWAWHKSTSSNVMWEEYYKNLEIYRGEY